MVMSKVGFTEGPWHGTGNGFVRQKGSGHAVAGIYGDREDCAVDDVMLANERLIAAAPKMLEALQLARDALGANAARDAVDAAITKATGAQP